MSTIQTSNIHFDSTGNNRIYVNTTSNSFILKVNNSNHSINSSVVFVGNSTVNATVNSIGIFKNGASVSAGLTGDYVVAVANAATPAGTIQTNTAYNISSYSSLYNVISSRTDFPYLGKWEPRNSHMETILYAATYGNGVFVVGGDTVGIVSTSTDTITWTSRSLSNATSNVYTLAYGNGVFVASGGFSLMSSTDAITWNNRTVANTNFIQEVEYGNGVFVAVGQAGSVQSSTNGTSWTNRTSSTTHNLNMVTYSNGVFLATGNNGAVIISTNGTTWTSKSTGNTANNLASAGGNGIFVVASQNQNFVLRTTNILDVSPVWTKHSFASAANNVFAAYMIYYNGVFIMAGGTSSPSIHGLIEYSTDGITWQVSNSFTQSDNYSIAAGNNIVIAGDRYGGIKALPFDYNVSTQFKVKPYTNNNGLKEYIRY